MLRRMVHAQFVFLVLLAAAGAAHAGASVSVAPDVEEQACGSAYPFPEDSLRLSVKIKGQKSIKLPFCSAYGKARAVAERDARGKYFVLLWYGVGRGTNATEQFLRVYQVGQNLKDIKTLLVHAASGLTSNWTYQVNVLKPGSGGLQLVLTLATYGSGTFEVPKDKRRIVYIQ